jgi:hypothetical protein
MPLRRRERRPPLEREVLQDGPEYEVAEFGPVFANPRSRHLHPLRGHAARYNLSDLSSRSAVQPGGKRVCADFQQ